jgi:hypothetical protein
MIATSAWAGHIDKNPDFHQPPWPDGFPQKILVYGYFKKDTGWHPREVDELTLEELEWIPIYEEAMYEAREFIRKQDDFQNG